MKIQAVVTYLTRQAGGMYESVRQLHQATARLPGLQVSVAGINDPFIEADLPAWAPLPVNVFEACGPSQFLYTPGLRRHLLEADADLLHRHGLWTYPSVAVSAWHRKFRQPYVISPHGMLDPWAVKNSGWKKRLAWMAYEREHLQNAACLRALCDSEARAMRQFGLKNPICVIPNGVTAFPLPDRASSRGPDSPFRAIPGNRNVLLYLGRLHPKKGLVNLLLAWKSALQARPALADSWALAIAGWDQGGHENHLRELSAENGLESSVHFLGPRFGDAKAACYRDCAAFILPSFSEGLPMVVLEAWSHGKPVVMTPECNLPEGFAAGAALRIETEMEGIRAGLMRLAEMSSEERETMGRRGHALVQDRFAWPRIASEMRQVYAWLLGREPQPECVRNE
jgi:poly(glycerol-phosphate) alpha-glucosyltransferase